MVHRPSLSALFPYTPLFRSCHRRRPTVAPTKLGYSTYSWATRLSPVSTRSGSPGNGSARDRKSTRLNSSHLVISYAVFCLKQEKNYLGKNILTLSVDVETYT